MPCHSWAEWRERHVTTQHGPSPKSESRRTTGRCDTDFSFLDACVDGVQQVGSVLVALGEFGQFLPDQLPLVVAHHPFKCRVHVLGGKKKNDVGVTKRKNRKSAIRLGRFNGQWP